jgi:hypothetical protein
LSAQGVISESLISFNITWSNPGKGQQSKWDQTKQGIEIHETDVYPDLQYTSAYAAPLYIKYTSGALLNDLISEINKIIDARIAGESNKTNEAKGELPSGPDAPKQLGSGEEDEEDDETQKALPSGPDAPKQLAGYSPGGDLVKVEEPGLPAIIDTKPEEVDVPEVTPDETSIGSEYAYTVVVKGDRLRFLEGQQERGAYSAGVKFLYQVSNNLSKVVSGETIDNKTKIWAEISMSGLLGRTFRMEFPEFDEKEFKFGGNLLAQILPSIELSFTPDQNSVYSKEKPELDIADVIKATNITLGSKTTSEIKALQKQIQKEIEAREPSQSEGSSDKQVASDKNK